MQRGFIEIGAFVRLSQGENPNATFRNMWSIVEHRAELEWESLVSPQTR